MNYLSKLHSKKIDNYFNPILLIFISIILILPAAIFFTPKIVSAQDSIILTDNQDRYPLGDTVEYLQDKEKKWTIDDVSSGEIGRQFKKITTKNINFSYTKSAYWLRFKLKNNSKLTKNWFIEISYLIENIDLFIKGENGFIKKKSGLSVPYNEREIKNRTFIFPIRIKPSEEDTYFIRLETKTSMIVPIEVIKQSALLSKTLNETLFFGIYFGFIIVMILYNFFIYLSIKDKSYLYYILYLFFWGYHMFTLTGLGFVYFYNTFAELERTFYINGSASICFLILFSKNFLKTNIYCKKIDMILSILIVPYLISATLTYIDFYYMRFESTLLLLMPIIVFYGGIISYKNGYKPARFFLLGWSIFLSSFIVYILKLIGIIPVNFVIQNIQYIGSALEMTLLSLALADRINIMKQTLIENVEYKLKAEAEIAKTQRLESLALLAGGMAHDLNNILTGLFVKVQLSASIIKKDADKAASYLSDVKHIFHMAKNIVNRIQTFSRGDTLFIKRQSLSELLSNAGNLVLSGSNSQCEVTILKDLWQVEFDKTQLNQVITNLLINADQAMPNGVISLIKPTQIAPNYSQ